MAFEFFVLGMLGIWLISSGKARALIQAVNSETPKEKSNNPSGPESNNPVDINSPTNWINGDPFHAGFTRP